MREAELVCQLIREAHTGDNILQVIFTLITIEGTGSHNSNTHFKGGARDFRILANFNSIQSGHLLKAISPQVVL